MKFSVLLFTFLLVTKAPAQTVKFEGKDVDLSEISPSLASELYKSQSQAYEKQKKVLEEALIEAKLQSLAKSSGDSVNKVRDRLLSIVKPQEKDAKEFFEANQSRIRQDYSIVKDDILRYLEQERIEEAKSNLIAKLTKEKGNKIILSKPVPPSFSINTSGFFTKGSSKSKVSVVEFADYRCPHCKTASNVFESLFKKYGDKVSFTFIDFPVLQGLSETVARGAFCAGKQDKFWQFHRKAFSKQEGLSIENLNLIAETLSLNMIQFKACLNDKESLNYVQSGIKEAERLGLSGTPSFFVNGVLVQRPSEQAIAKEIEKLL